MERVYHRPAVLIADDHPLVSQGLKALLVPRYDVVGVVTDGREVIDTALRLRPDIVLLDLSMPHRNGLELLPELGTALPTAKFVVVTMHVDRTMADLAMDAGAHGFIPKESSAEELKEAIDEVLAGRRFISPRVNKRTKDPAAIEHPELEKLTPRHRQILRLIGEGKTSAEIAEELNLSRRTVDFHRVSIRRILGITSDSGLALFAVMMRVSAQPRGDS